MSRQRSRISILLSLCLCLALLCLVPAQAGAVGTGVIDRVLCSLNFEPVVMMELQYVSVSTSSPNAAITSAWWTDANGSVVSGQFGKGNYTLHVDYAANPGYVFGQGIPGYVNNNGGGVSVSVSADGSTASLQKTFEAIIWTPTSIKDPTSASADYGGWVSFAASSMYAESHEWYLESPDGRSTFLVSLSNANFPTLTYTGENTERLNLHNLPGEIDGWKVFCRHWSVDHVTWANSRTATIHVNNIPAPEPTANITPVPLTVPTPEPEVTAAPEAVPAVMEEPMVTAIPDAHHHEYKWLNDDSSHWRVCDSCGEVGEKEPHLFVWHETRAATAEQEGEETGVCSVCGYTVTRSLGRADTASRSALGLGEKLGLDGFSDVQILVAGGAAACLLLLIITSAFKPKRRRRRR